MFQAGLVQAEVAGAADAGDVGGLPHGSFDAGADVVAVFPVLGGLAGAGGRDGLVDLAGAQEQLAVPRIRVLLFVGKPNWDLLPTVTPR